MSYRCKFLVVLFTVMITMNISAQEPSAKTTKLIKQQINNLRTAHLSSDTELAGKIYHNELILTSQSGKKYGKEEVLANIKNKFERYENSGIHFLKISSGVVLTNYINERKFEGFDKGVYRLTVIWKKIRGDWTIISMQSSKIKSENIRKLLTN